MQPPGYQVSVIAMYRPLFQGCFINVIDRRLNVLLYPDAVGGALHVAVEEFGLAFGEPMKAAAIAKLGITRSKIEKSLTDNAAPFAPGAAEVRQRSCGSTAQRKSSRPL